jgi:dolichol-phosphate mannosyltransferase
MKPQAKKLSILLPVKNEKENISVMLKILFATLDLSSEVIIIYDSPDDNTVSIVQSLQKKIPNIILLQNKLGKGVANAVLSGINKSSGEYILVFASDDVGPALAIEDMVYLMDKGCDLVSSTRYAHGGKRLGGSLIQSMLSRTGNYFFRLAVGTTLTDSTTGIKMFRKSLINKIHLESKIGWAFVFELSIKAQIANVKLGEVPIISIDRLYGGSSSFKASPWFREYLKWFIYGVKNLHRRGKKNKIMIKIPKNIVLD